MNREQLKELLPAIQHYVSGGDLWMYEYGTTWVKQQGFIYTTGDLNNIIEDKNFEARKVFALGGEIQWKSEKGNWVNINPEPWLDAEYRVKPENVYEYIWYQELGNGDIRFTEFHTTQMNPEYWKKFKPSKKVKGIIMNNKYAQEATSNDIDACKPDKKRIRVMETIYRIPAHLQHLTWFQKKKQLAKMFFCKHSVEPLSQDELGYWSNKYYGICVKCEALCELNKH